MSDQNGSSNKDEGIALGRRCVTAAKIGDIEALFNQVEEYINQPDVLVYAVLHLSMFAGDMLDAFMDDDEWRDFLMNEEK